MQQRMIGGNTQSSTPPTPEKNIQVVGMHAVLWSNSSIDPPRINAAQVAITGQLDTALLDDEEWAQYQAAYAKHPDPVHAGAPGQ